MASPEIAAKILCWSVVGSQLFSLDLYLWPHRFAECIVKILRWRKHVQWWCKFSGGLMEKFVEITYQAPILFTETDIHSWVSVLNDSALTYWLWLKPVIYFLKLIGILKKNETAKCVSPLLHCQLTLSFFLLNWKFLFSLNFFSLLQRSRSMNRRLMSWPHRLRRWLLT